MLRLFSQKLGLHLDARTKGAQVLPILNQFLLGSNILSQGEVLAIFQGSDVYWIGQIINLVKFSVFLLGYQDNPWMDVRICGITTHIPVHLIELFPNQQRT